MRLIKLLPAVSLLLLAFACSDSEQHSWKPGESPLATKWVKDIDYNKPWDNYPRPGMVRDKWINLNGLWDFALTDSTDIPVKWKEKILVPYPVESALSGIMKELSHKQTIWYKREITIPRSWKGSNILLNFEASDWETRVYIDGKEVGIHRGGFDPFSFDISSFVKTGKKHTLMVSVWDPTEQGTQPRGKQLAKPHGIWYTPSSGIWQTVWLEPVNRTYIKSFRLATDIESGNISLAASVKGEKEGLSLKLEAGINNSVAGSSVSSSPENASLTIEDHILWSPDNPVLYDLDIELIRNGVVIDKIKSYTGFRKISLGKCEDGFTRILLNNKFVFQNGTLDQGFWPDGLYTPPTEEAMAYDLQITKEMGFNMLRKHVKVENRRFYYLCDKMGLLVWQDMPSGDKYIHGDMEDIEKSDIDAAQFKNELAAMIATRFNNPSIIIWVPFNEGWGQYNTAEISEYIKELDPTRLVNSASGWTDRGTGDILDIHNYPEPRMPEPEENRAIVLGEFGGLGFPVQDHTWEQKNWGYRNMDSVEELLGEYAGFYSDISKFIKKGLSAVIYTQITDVETETNGLLTYDRAVDKMGKENLFKINTGMLQ